MAYRRHDASQARCPFQVSKTARHHGTDHEESTPCSTYEDGIPFCCCTTEMEATIDEKVKIASNFLLESPPGEVNDVFNGRAPRLSSD